MNSLDAPTTLLWFRRDLRLTDNPALAAASERGVPIVAVYIRDEESDGLRPLGAASRWWLRRSLDSLAADLDRLGVPLILRRGPAAHVIETVAAECGADAVYWNRCYEPAEVARDRAIMATLKGMGLDTQSFNANALFEPWTVTTKAGTPYRVFTQFWRACSDRSPPPQPRRRSRKALPPPRSVPAAESIWDTDGGDGLDFGATWSPGEKDAQDRLDAFAEGALSDYASARDRPDRDGTSALSPHLHFGEIGPRQVWHRVEAAAGAQGRPDRAMPFQRQLGWREFCVQLLFHNPELPSRPLQPHFAAFPWRNDESALAAWREGRTGYPQVDAGMRQLAATGWMHNRFRMVAASFLVKHLMVDWRLGEAWFWERLVDADLANNVANWQWVAGCGADAAPFFRIFNPVRQGERFDSAGIYVRRYVPELRDLPDKFVHAPWAAPSAVLSAAGVTIGETYPDPVVDHAAARDRALSAYRALRDDS